MRTSFEGPVASEGARQNPVLNIPARLAWPLPGWTWLDIPNYKRACVYARKRYRCPSGLMSLPAWSFRGIEIGKPVTATIETAVENLKPRTGTTFDWTDFIDRDEVFPTEADGVLQLWNRYSEPFSLLRCPPESAVYRLLGVYQAEGSKSEQAHDFLFANSNALLLANVASLVEQIGIDKSRMYLEVLHAKGEAPEAAEAKYRPLGIRISTTRLRSGKGGNAGVLHIRNSLLFKRMICRALDRIFANEFPNKEAALAYALGWLDGDGTVTITGGSKTSLELRLAGYEAEQRVTVRALCQGLAWPIPNFKFGSVRSHSTLSLCETDRAIDLAYANAFSFSMNRVRLLYGIELRLALDRPTSAEARTRFATLAPEIEKLRKLSPPELLGYTGVKGSPYPT